VLVSVCVYYYAIGRTTLAGECVWVGGRGSGMDAGRSRLLLLLPLRRRQVARRPTGEKKKRVERRVDMPASDDDVYHGGGTQEGSAAEIG